MSRNFDANPPLQILKYVFNAVSYSMSEIEQLLMGAVSLFWEIAETLELQHHINNRLKRNPASPGACFMHDKDL